MTDKPKPDNAEKGYIPPRQPDRVTRDGPPSTPDDQRGYVPPKPPSPKPAEPKGG